MRGSAFTFPQRYRTRSVWPFYGLRMRFHDGSRKSPRYAGHWDPYRVFTSPRHKHDAMGRKVSTCLLRAPISMTWHVLGVTRDIITTETFQSVSHPGKAVEKMPLSMFLENALSVTEHLSMSLRRNVSEQDSRQCFSTAVDQDPYASFSLLVLI
jgi:hypothetical protein